MCQCGATIATDCKLFFFKNRINATDSVSELPVGTPLLSSKQPITGRIRSSEMPRSSSSHFHTENPGYPACSVLSCPIHPMRPSKCAATSSTDDWFSAVCPNRYRRSASCRRCVASGTTRQYSSSNAEGFNISSHLSFRLGRTY